jgi:three-Cys-motif partner protein
MPTDEIEDRPYSEGTLTKLAIFEMYARAWLPVFTSAPDPLWKKLHVFDFFAGRGRDCEGTAGSPVRLLKEVAERRSEIIGKRIQMTVTACDGDVEKVKSLNEYVATEKLVPAGIRFDTQAGDFADTFAKYLPVLKDRDTACLVLLDQYGFKEVDAEIFKKLTTCPSTDFLLFVSTHYLHRFAEHPIVRRYMELERAADYYHAHRVVLDWYRSQIPPGTTYYLAPFSFRKSTNVYCVIFGSGHPRGMEQFLNVAWQKDKLNGEADYDLNRESFSDIAPFLPMDMFEKPKKKQVFEASLEQAIREKRLLTETALYLFCIENGMLPSHSSAVIAKLKKEGVIVCDFKSPNRESLKNPRPFRVLG